MGSVVSHPPRPATWPGTTSHPPQAVSRPAPRQPGRDTVTTAPHAAADSELFFGVPPARWCGHRRPPPLSSKQVRVAPYLEGDADHVLAIRRARARAEAFARWQHASRSARCRPRVRRRT